MRVGIVINTTWNIFNFRKGLIQALLKEGHEVIALSPPDEYVDRLVAIGCEYVPVEMDNKGSNPVKDWALKKRLENSYKEAELDIVLQYTIKPNIYGTLAARRLGIPVINNVSGLGTVFIRSNFVSKVAQRLYRYAFKYADQVFFQNEDDRRLFGDLRLVNATKTDLLPGSGIDLKRFQPTPLPEEPTQNFLLIARMLFDKGVVEFAEAIRILQGKGYSLNAWLCGKIDTSASLGVSRDMIHAWEKEGLVNYLGTTDNIEELIHQCHAVVLPSYREGTPRTLLEGGAMGRPLIATDVPGCKEVVNDGFNGFLCKAKDAQDLARVLEKFLKLTPEGRENLGRNSRTLVEQKFDEKLVIEKYLKSIKELTNGI